MTITARSIRRHGRLDPVTRMRLMPRLARRRMTGPSRADEGAAANRFHRRRRRNQIAKESRRRNR